MLIDSFIYLFIPQPTVRVSLPQTPANACSAGERFSRIGAFVIKGSEQEVLGIWAEVKGIGSLFSLRLSLSDFFVCLFCVVLLW